MKDAARNSKLSSIFAWPLTIMGLGPCFIQDNQISTYLNFDIFATILLIISLNLILINQIASYLNIEETKEN
jgi:hypothetical protein